MARWRSALPAAPGGRLAPDPPFEHPGHAIPRPISGRGWRDPAPPVCVPATSSAARPAEEMTGAFAIRVPGNWRIPHGLTSRTVLRRRPHASLRAQPNTRAFRPEDRHVASWQRPAGRKARNRICTLAHARARVRLFDQEPVVRKWGLTPFRGPPQARSRGSGGSRRAARTCAPATSGAGRRGPRKRGAGVRGGNRREARTCAPACPERSRRAKGDERSGAPGPPRARRRGSGRKPSRGAHVRACDERRGAPGPPRARSRGSGQSPV